MQTDRPPPPFPPPAAGSPVIRVVGCSVSVQGPEASRMPLRGGGGHHPGELSALLQPGRGRSPARLLQPCTGDSLTQAWLLVPAPRLCHGLRGGGALQEGRRRAHRLSYWQSEQVHLDMCSCQDRLCRFPVSCFTRRSRTHRGWPHNSEAHVSGEPHSFLDGNGRGGGRRRAVLQHALGGCGSVGTWPAAAGRRAPGLRRP